MPPRFKFSSRSDPRRWLLLALAGVGCASGAPAVGNPQSPEVLPPWVVSESQLRPDLAPVRATAVLPAEAWSGRAVETLADAFRHIPGALMQESFGGFEPPRLSIRGSGVQSAPSSRGVALLLDQLPLGLADGSFNAALLDPLLATQVEVQRGLDGWRSAPATMGGALDLRTTSAAPQSENSVRGEGGSFGAVRTRARTTWLAGGTSATAAVSHARQNGFRDHSEQARTVALAALRHDVAPETRATFTVYHAHARYAVPGPLTLAAAEAQPRSVSSEVRRDRPGRTAGLTRVAGTLGQHTKAREFELGLSFAHSTDDFQQLQPNGASASSSDDAAFYGTFAQRFTLAQLPHQVRFTARTERGWRTLERFRNDAGQRGPRFSADRLRPSTTTVLIEDGFALTRELTFTIGAGQLWARRDSTDQSGARADARLHASATLPQAGIHWSITPDHGVTASISRVAEPPTFDDLLVVGGTYPSFVRRLQPLALQHGATTETGYRGRAGPLAWDLAAYRSEWKNEILRLADARGVARGAVNATPTVHTGVEASVRWLLREREVRLTLTTTAAWNRFRFRSDPVFGRGPLAGNPPHTGAAELGAEWPRGAFAAVSADWTHGSTRVDHAGRLEYGGRTLLHVRAGHRFARGWLGFVEVRNLADRASIASTAGVLDLARNPAATSIFLPAPGRSFRAGMEWRR